MKKEIVYILGLSHVGSTLMDLIMGNQPNCVGLGEICQVIRPNANVLDKKPSCSCGQPVSTCEFWGPTAEAIRQNSTLSIGERYHLVIDVFNDVFGPETILVDSSKLLMPLKILLDSNRYDIKVIYLIRDVRAWTISRLNTRKTFPQYFTKHGNYIKRLRQQYGYKIESIRWLIPFLTKTAGYFFWIWYLQNKAYKKFLIQNRINHLQIGYDELGMQKDLILSKIQQFMGETIEDVDLSTEFSKSHIIVGNVKKTDPNRRKSIIYDNRWLYRTEWLLSAAIFRNILNYNNREVYKNLKRNSIW